MESSNGLAFGSPPLRRRYFNTSDDHSKNQDETSSDERNHNSTSYNPYPSVMQPTYERYKAEAGSSYSSTDFTDSHREAVMSALKSLQDKIRQLELERAHAEDNLRSLASETSKYKSILHQNRGVGTEGNNSDIESSRFRAKAPGDSRVMAGDVSGLADITHGTDVHGKLESAEQRCHMLEKQLDCMRKMVSSAEQERSQALKRSLLIEKQRQDSDICDLRHQLDKISDLEREHLRLTATQTLAESKIKALEEKLKEEKHYRKVMQDRAAELETAAEAQRILMEATGDSEPQKPQKLKKKKKKTRSAHPARNHITNGTATNGKPCSRHTRPKSADSEKIPGMEPLDHYKLNLAEMPFVAGKSTGPSHSLPANFQEVLSMMKMHNPQLCASPRSHSRNVYHHFTPPRPGTARMVQRTKARKEAAARASAAELSQLLLQLQEEFTQLTTEHEELSRQIADCRDPGTREDLERELDSIVAKMEMKGDQIGGLRAYQDRSQKKKKKLVSSGGTSSSGYGSTGGSGFGGSGEVEVTTTVRAKGRGPLVVVPDSSSKAQASLNLYKDLKKIQTTLRQDDVSWD